MLINLERIIAMDSNHDFDVENINEPSVEELTAIDEEEKSEYGKMISQQILATK